MQWDSLIQLYFLCKRFMEGTMYKFSFLRQEDRNPFKTKKQGKTNKEKPWVDKISI